MELKQGYKQTELGLIPEDWQVKRIDQVSSVIGGGTPSTRINLFWEGNINWFTPTEVGYGKYLFESKRKLTIDGLKNSSANILPLGTILLTSRAGIGDLGILNIEAATNQGFQSLIANANISNEFLYYLMLTKKNELLQNASGSTFLEISPSKVKCIKIILPPLPEQTAIATALSNIDELISQTEKLIDKKKAIKQGVMQELLKPKEGWVTKKLDDVAIFRRGSFPQPYGLDKWYDDISGKPFVQVYDVDENKKLKIETKRYISSEAQQMSVFAKEGTIVLTIQGSIGRIAITQYDAYIDRTLLIFESYKYDFDKYFFMHTIHQLFELEKQNAPGGIIKTITKEALRNFKISYPDFAEQKNIGIIISDLEKEIVIIESKLQKQKLQKQGMMQTLLTGKIRLL